MQFVIKDPVPVKLETPNSYEVVVSAMFGDGDGFKDVTLKPFVAGQDEKALEFLLNTLAEMAAYSANGDSYHHLKGFEAWFGGENYIDEDYYMTYRRNDTPYEEFKTLMELVGERYAYWPNDSLSDMSYDYDGHKVFYYDENLVKHHVQVSL
jgi:hypothetical protein